MPGLHEVIVVNGGSEDRTVSLARSFPGTRVHAAPRGRAALMQLFPLLSRLGVPPGKLARLYKDPR